MSTDNKSLATQCEKTDRFQAVLPQIVQWVKAYNPLGAEHSPESSADAMLVDLLNYDWDQDGFDLCMLLSQDDWFVNRQLMEILDQLCTGKTESPSFTLPSSEKDRIYKLAICSGFKPKLQPDHTMDLNPYVYDFAYRLIEAAVNTKICGKAQEVPCNSCSTTWPVTSEQLKQHEGQLWCNHCWNSNGEYGIAWNDLSKPMLSMGNDSPAESNADSGLAYRLECAESALDERCGFIDAIQNALGVSAQPHQTLDHRIVEAARLVPRLTRLIKNGVDMSYITVPDIKTDEAYKLISKILENKKL